MADHESTMKWKIDISDLKKEMQEAKRSINQANAEFKTATAGMDRWSKSTDGLEAKLAQLNKTLPYQKTILEQLEQQYKITAEQMGDNSKEAVDLQIKIEEQRATIVKTESNISKYNEQLADMHRKQAESETATSKLNKTIQEQETAVEGLKKQYADAVLEYGKTSDEAEDLAKQIEELSGELKDNKNRLKEADSAADEFDKSLQDVDESAEDAIGGFSVMKGALADLVASGIKAAVQGFRDLAQAAFDAYQEFDEGEDNVIKATGATGEAAEKLALSYKKVTKSVVGDMGTMGSALGEVNTRFGFTGEKLEDATTQFLKFADITGSDAVSAVQLVSRAMGDAGIDSSQYAQVLDDLAIAAQASGISVDKLAENLTKYGAPMRALGFDTKEAIAIFSQWEKAGVNTEIAFSGMKNAISKWSAEGKDAKEEFKKVLDEIESTPDIASATTKAIEIFGKKAGPDLADAIKGGRFEYSDFLELLEGSTGTVTNTYEATQDGFDKINLALQGARVEMGAYVGDMLNKYQPQIESFIKQVVNGFKLVLDYAPEILDALKAIATAFVTYKAVSSVMNLVDSYKKLQTAIAGGQTLMQALNLTMSASPVALIAGAVVGLGSALAIYAKNAYDAKLEQYGLNEEQSLAIDEAKKLADAYKQTAEMRDESVQGITAEFGYIQELKDEYNGLIDENGKVKKGYEDRANFILSTLAESLGVEVSEIQKVIDQNGKLGDSIDEIIKKKQAEAVLSANEALYTEAITNRSKALETLSKAQETLSEREAKYKETKEQVNAVWDKYNELLKYAPEEAQRYISTQGYLIDANEEAKQSYLKAKEGVEEAQNAWIGYNSTIQNYEGLAEAIISGDAEKINQAMQNMVNNFITAETGNRESLERQVKNYEENLSNLETAIKNGTPNVTQEMVNQAKSMVDAANAELDKLPPEASETGAEAGSAFAEGVGSKAGDAKSAGKKLGTDADSGADAGSKGMKKTGAEAGADFADGVDSKQDNAEKAGENLAEEAERGSKEHDSYSSGSNFGEGFFNGIGSWVKSVWNKGVELAKSAWNGLKAGGGEGSPWKTTTASGEFFGEGFELGITAMIKPVTSAASNMAKQAVSALKEDFNAEMKTVGSDGANSLISGISAITPTISASIGNLKSSVQHSASGVNGDGVGSFEYGTGGKVQNVVFNQTINAPKAPSRLEIYRQTNSLLFSAKVGLNNV